MARARTAEDLAAKVARLERRLETVEGRREDLGLARLVRAWLPTEVRGHLRAARREQLLAARAFLDHWIERDGREKPRRRERISVE